MNVIDLTFAYQNGQLAGNPRRHPVVAITPMGRVGTDSVNTCSILLGSHTGTHMDSPRHFVPGGRTIDKTDLSLCVGDVTVVDFSRFAPGTAVELKDVATLTVKERMLFSFGWCKRFGTPGYYQDPWPYFTLEAVLSLKERGMRLMAMDTPSPDPQAGRLETDFPVHKAVLPADLILVESLANTGQIDFQKNYIFAALPLKVRDADGAPCRVVLMEAESGF